MSLVATRESLPNADANQVWYPRWSCLSLPAWYGATIWQLFSEELGHDSPREGIHFFVEIDWDLGEDSMTFFGLVMGCTLVWKHRYFVLPFHWRKWGEFCEVLEVSGICLTDLQNFWLRQFFVKSSWQLWPTSGKTLRTSIWHITKRSDPRFENKSVVNLVDFGTHQIMTLWCELSVRFDLLSLGFSLLWFINLPCQIFLVWRIVMRCQFYSIIYQPCTTKDLVAGKYIYIAGEDSASDASISLLGNDAMEGIGCTKWRVFNVFFVDRFFERTNSNSITWLFCCFSETSLQFPHLFFWDSFTKHSRIKFQGLLGMFPQGPYWRWSWRLMACRQCDGKMWISGRAAVAMNFCSLDSKLWLVKAEGKLAKVFKRMFCLVWISDDFCTFMAYGLILAW